MVRFTMALFGPFRCSCSLLGPRYSCSMPPELSELSPFGCSAGVSTAWAACSKRSTDGECLTCDGGGAGMGECAGVAGAVRGPRLHAEPQAVDAAEGGCKRNGAPAHAAACRGGAHAAEINVRSSKSCFATALSTRGLVMSAMRRFVVAITCPT